MRFPPSFLEEIRARLPASTVVGRRVKLKKQGREFKGLSPFHQEKTPSFFVNDTKGKWFDFSAQKNGDIFTFVMETEGLSFPEAVERLAGEAGVPMPGRDADAERREAERGTLHDVLELAAKFFEESLQSRAGAAARGYLLNRSLGPDLQRQFRVGYARPDRNALKEYLAAKAVPPDQMIAAGLLVSGDDVPVSFDRFRDRVIFPITDFRGQIVGFGGRALSADVPAKYLNSPETELFHKGSLLYNGAAARKAAHDFDTVIAVEGYVDVIQMVGAGFPHTVAPLGTALTERQLQILWRMGDEPILCFDGDNAGKRAAYRAAELAMPLLAPGKSLRFALLPEGKDPDDLVRSGGREAVAAVIGAARPLVDLLWTRETEAGVFDTPERRAALEARLREMSRSIADESVRRHYVQAFSERIAEFFPDVRPQRPDDRRRRYGSERGRDGRYPAASVRPLHSPVPVSDRLRRSSLLAGRGGHPLREAVLLITVINHPALLHDRLDEFADLEFTHPDLEELRSFVLRAVAHQPETDHNAGDDEGNPLRETLISGRFGPLIARLERELAAVRLWPALQATSETDAARGWTQALTLHRRGRTLHKDLKEAEAALASEPTEANLARLVDIQTQMASTEGTEALVEGFGSAVRETRIL